MDTQELKNVLEAALLAADQPLNMNQLAALFEEETAPPASDIRAALTSLEEDCEGRGIELKLVASGWRLQVRESYQPWIQRLWQERPPRYSRALLETLALIAYRQPITRGEIEQVRGVSVSTNIMRTLQEREWVRIVGHRDVPGRPALFGTTRRFLDYFNLASLDDLPTLAEIRDIEGLEPELALTDAAANEGTADGNDTSGSGDDADDPMEDHGDEQQGQRHETSDQEEGLEEGLGEDHEEGVDEQGPAEAAAKDGSEGPAEEEDDEEDLVEPRSVEGGEATDDEGAGEEEERREGGRTHGAAD